MTKIGPKNAMWPDKADHISIKGSQHKRIREPTHRRSPSKTQ